MQCSLGGNRDCHRQTPFVGLLLASLIICDYSVNIAKIEWEILGSLMDDIIECQSNEFTWPNCALVS